MLKKVWWWFKHILEVELSCRSSLIAKSIDKKEHMIFTKCPISGFMWGRKKTPILQCQFVRPVAWGFADAVCDSVKVSYDLQAISPPTPINATFSEVLTGPHEGLSVLADCWGLRWTGRNCRVATQGKQRTEFTFGICIESETFILKIKYMLGMYFNSWCKKVTLVLFWGSFLEMGLSLMSNLFSGTRRNWGKKRLKLVSICEENRWHFCLCQLSLTGHIAGTCLCTASNVWFHVVPSLCRNGTQRKTQWRSNVSEMTTADFVSVPVFH